MNVSVEKMEADVTNAFCQLYYQPQMLGSVADPIDSTSLTLIDEMGNGGIHSKLYPPPIESNYIHGGPLMPVISSQNRY